MKRSAWLVLLGLTAGCSSSSSAPSLIIDVTLGQETGALDMDPAVTKLTVSASSSGQVIATSSAAPGGTLNFGQITSGTQLGLDATGVDATGATVMLGRSLNGIVAGVDGKVPLFVQRTKAWARPPGGLARSHLGAPAAVVGEQYLMLTGGTLAAGSGTAVATATEFYDLLGLGTIDAAPFPIVATSVVMQGDLGIAFSDTAASLVDFTNQTTADVGLPAGLTSFADVSGGRPIVSPSGVIYLVGATRASPPTDAVIAVATDGTLSALHLTEPRAGAAVAWIANVGLVIAGGSATGQGVEVLQSNGTTFGTRPFAADPTAGAALVTMGGDTPLAALVGGVLDGNAAPVRTLDAGCASSCVTTTSTATLPVSLTDAWAYSLAPGRILVIGSEIAGDKLDRTFTLDLSVDPPPTPSEIFLREPRSGATPVPAPNATLALMGGQHPDGTPALSVEMFFPN